MTDDRFEDLMRDAARTYRQPPEAPLDAMWKEIEAAHFDAGKPRREGTVDQHATPPRLYRSAWLIGLAATLVIGIGVGRWSTSIVRSGTQATQPLAAAPTPVGSVATAHVDSGLTMPYDVETSRYLGQTAALLIALPSEVRSGHADDQFVDRAGDLLTRTRLLLDSPAGSDAQTRALLEDLELVLAQIVQLQHHQSRTELDLINQALEQRDVIPRLRAAVADISAN